VDDLITDRTTAYARPRTYAPLVRIARWWPSRRALLLDALAAALVLAVELGGAAVQTGPPDQDPGPQSTPVLAVLVAVAVLLRRRLPLPLLGLALLDGMVRGAVSLAMPFAAYAVLRYVPSSRLRWAAIAGAALLELRLWELGSLDDALANVANTSVLVLLPAAVGAWVRTRAQLMAALVGRAERAEAEQQLRAREAVVQERNRIAQEMHDIVGHRVSLMVLQAGAIEMAAGDPDRVRQLAGQVQDAGRRSLVELRQVVGLLHESGDTADQEAVPLAPQPTLADVDDLVADSRRAGVEVSLERLGTPRTVDPTVGRTAYRVVQEALTNAGKHAPGGAVAVTLDFRPAELAVTVVNRRAARAPAELPGGGYGLVGLRERVRTVGGTLRAEPRLDGGFGVEAVMPG
jgi:signal transduction histidine kinase